MSTNSKKYLFIITACLFWISCTQGGVHPIPVPQTTVDNDVPQYKAGVPTIDEAVKTCQEAYNAFFGPQGCIPDKMKDAEIQAACQAYVAWSDNGYPCGDAAYSAFFTCLKEIDCSVFDYEEDETALKESFLDCRTEFVKDMNICWAEKKYP